MENDAPSLHVVGERVATGLAFARVAALVGAAVLVLGLAAPELVPELRGAIEAETMLVMVVVTAPVWLAVGAIARERVDNTLHKAAIGSFSCQLAGWALTAWSPVAWFGEPLLVVVGLLLFLIGLGTFLFARPFHLAPTSPPTDSPPPPRRASPQTAAALEASVGRPRTMIGDKALSPATRAALAATASLPRRSPKRSKLTHQPVVAGAGAVLVGLWFAIKNAAQAKFLARWSLFRTLGLALRQNPLALLVVVANGVLLVGSTLLVAVGVRLLRADGLGRRARRVGTAALLVALHQITFRLLHLGCEPEQAERLLRVEHALGAACHAVLWWVVFCWLGELLVAHQEEQVRALTVRRAEAPPPAG
jgi:hypothetical protein